MDTVSIGRNKKDAVNMRFSIQSGDLFRLPYVHQLRIEQGTVWVTQNGQDIVLRSGDCISEERLSPDALLSVAGNACAVLEVILPKPENAMMLLGNLFAMSQHKAA